MHFSEQLEDLLPLWGICEHGGGCYIAAAFPYLLEQYPRRNVSRYAVVRDYHAICGARLEQACTRLRKLFPGKAFQWHCDNSSLPEVALAEKAGLGVRGRHNLLITQAYGSWVFLGVITSEVPEAQLRASAMQANAVCVQASHPCEHCPGHCLKACPTGALSAGSFEKTRCISYISQKKGVLSPEEAAALRQTGTVWGCDICQEACPRNQKSKIDPLPEFLVDPIAHVTKETPMEGRAYAWRGKAVLHRNLELLEESP